MHIVAIVFWKEMLDHLRDRRSIIVAMVYPLLGPLLLGLLFTFVGSRLNPAANHPRNSSNEMVAAVQHQHAAPDLIRFLIDRGVHIVPSPPDPTEAVRRDELPFVLVLPETPVAGDAGPFDVRVVSNPSRFPSIAATGRIMELLQDYDREATNARLRAAGVSEKLLSTVRVLSDNVGNAASLSVTMLSMIPPFIMFTLFIGGVHVILDSTNGERERGSFEPLMLNPVTREQLLTGKLCAGYAFTLMTLVVQVAAFWLMLHLVPREAVGLGTLPGAWRLGMVALVCLPVALLAVATQLILSAVTRSPKEAQTYLGMLPLVPGMAGMVVALAPVQLHARLAAIPTFGQTLLMGRIVRGELIGGQLVAVSSVATLAASLLLLAIAFRLYQREEILFPK